MIFNFTKKDPEKELVGLKKAFEILHERYKRKTITLEQFSKQCNEINKKIEKYQKQLDKMKK